MSWTAPRTFVVGEILTAAIMNTHVRDNMLETAPAKGTAAGILYVSAANALTLLAASGNGSKVVRVNSGGTAMELATPDPTSLEAAAQEFVEGGNYKGFFALGPNYGANPATGVLVGLGFVTYLTGSSTMSRGTVANSSVGAWNASGVSGHAGFLGPEVYAPNDWAVFGRARFPNGTNQTIVFGAKPSAGFADENNIIALRKSASGNVFGVCDSGGSETTRDFGVDGSTEFAWGISAHSGGTIVRFWLNGAQVGADVTTNIYTSALLRMSLGVVESGGSTREVFIVDCFGWREAA